MIKFFRHIRQKMLSEKNAIEKANEEDNEKLIALRKCIKKLNEGNKAIVALYLEGLAYREISDILGLSENHIAVKIKRIKSKLFNCINETL